MTLVLRMRLLHQSIVITVRFPSDPKLIMKVV